MEKILALAIRHNLLLISDECYCHFLYDGRKPFSLGSSKEREHLLIVDSFSKTYAMTGWRVGFALGPARLLANMLKLQSHSTSNPTSIAQKAALAAIEGPQDHVRHDAAEYRRRRDRRHRGTAIDTGHTLRSSPRRLLRLPECRVLSEERRFGRYLRAGGAPPG